MVSTTERPKATHEKPATPEYPILDLISRRWSPVVFSTEPVEQQKLHVLFEAARWAPSSYNEQPWFFIISLRGSKQHETIWSCLASSNQQWTQYAPVLGISVTRLSFQRNNKPNRHAYHDVGLAMGQLCIQATSMDLKVHQMAGFDVEAARERLKIPKDHDPVAAFAVGYAASLDRAEEALRTRDLEGRSRKAQSTFLFEGEFGRQWKG